MPHHRDPDSLAKEIWFYSLPRRSQSAALRRLAIVLSAVAVVLILAALIQPHAVVGAVAAVGAVVTLEVTGRLRGRRQRTQILEQLQAGVNPQLVDAVGSAYPNRRVILVALAVAVAAGAVALLVIGQLA